MFKPLVRVIPELSGNVQLLCVLTDYIHKPDNSIECNVRSANFEPLSSTLYKKKVQADLLSSSYEFDIKRYFTSYSDIFYKPVFDFLKQDMTLIDKSNIQPWRNLSLEMGCKRISYKIYGNQFAFFAPFYIDSNKDIPSKFKLTISLNAVKYKTTKTVYVNIGREDDRNYLGVYLNKYTSRLDNTVAFMDNSNLSITYYGIDMLHGGFTKTTDPLVSSLFNTKLPIQMYDKTICDGFKRNNVAMKQIIPLCFVFDLSKILTGIELLKYNNCDVHVKGSYVDSDNIESNIYDFNWNYDSFTENILAMNQSNGCMEYIDGYINNIMDVDFPSFNDKWITKWMFDNKLNADWCRWKMQYSDDNHPYINNMSWAFSKNQNSNYKYKGFPTMFVPMSGYAEANKTTYNLIFPLADDKDIYNLLNPASVSKYKSIMDNFCLDWFTIALDKDNINLDSINWSNVDDGYAYFNGVLYNLNNVYNNVDNMDDSKKIDKFAFLLHPDVSNIKTEQYIQDNLKFGTYCLEKTSNGNVEVNESLFNNHPDNKEMFVVDSKTFNAKISGRGVYKKLDSVENIIKNNGELVGKYFMSGEYNIDYWTANLLFNRYDLGKYSKLFTIKNICTSSDEIDVKRAKLRKLITDILYVSTNTLDIFINILLSADESTIPELFSDSFGYLLKEKLPFTYLEQYYDSEKYEFTEVIAPYINNPCGKLYFSTLANYSEYTEIPSSNTPINIVNGIYQPFGCVLFFESWFINKSSIPDKISINKNIVNNYKGENKEEALNIFIQLSQNITNLLKAYINNMDNLSNNQIINNTFTYYPLWEYDTFVSLENIVIKNNSFSNYNCYNNSPLNDNNVLFVHSFNDENFLKKFNISPDNIEYKYMYGKVLNPSHIKSLFKMYIQTGGQNNVKTPRLYKQFKKSVKRLSSGRVDIVYEYVPINLTDYLQVDTDLRFDNKTGMFFDIISDNEVVYYNIVELTKFYKLNKTIWDNISIYDKSKYIDMLIYRPLDVIEYDLKYYKYSKVSSANNTAICYDTDTLLYPCFNIEFMENRDNTLIYQNLILNNISTVYSMFGSEEYKRYNTDSDILFIKINDESDVINNPSLTIYDKIDVNSSISYHCSNKDLDGFYKSKINIIEKDGIRYGYYMLNVLLDNTSNMFNIRGFIDTDYSIDSVYSIDQINSLKYITTINGINIIQNPEYMQLLFKQLCPFSKLNLLASTQWLNTIITPSVFNLTNLYSVKGTDKFKEKELVFNPQTIMSAKKQILQRYTYGISPLITPVSVIQNQYNLKFKTIKTNLLTTGMHPSLDDYSLYNEYTDINKFNGIRIYNTTNNNDITFETIYPIEYKHYNDSKLINLESQIIIPANKVYKNYEELLEAESESSTISVFANYIRKFRNEPDDNKILFLYKKYKHEYEVSTIYLDNYLNTKTYSLTYKFILL